MPDAMISQIWDVQINFLSVMDLIYNFKDTSVDNDSIVKSLLTRVNNFCDGQINFMYVMDLIYIFDDTSVDHDFFIKGLLIIFNNFSLSSKPSNANTSVTDILNIFSYIFLNCLMVP